ncbi:BRO-N domain-containing protein [Yersinia pseudotuberculosis]|uniref:BRO-N domain-containing protein n=1 Tax=Yersinia pseudotuberculosis TaxID=633 RepID=UPI001A9E637E|nr:BRO family protein [Yersinia pseudotuberculosis]MBO1563541.1 DNA-binding protein [Yersinia pseudotuberculosis]
MSETTLTQPIVFRNESLGIELQAMCYNGNPVFFAIEVAKALGYGRPTDAIAAHCKSLIKIKHGEMQCLGLEPKPNGISLLPEADLYRLILRSKLPSAEKVQDWVCEEVLPSIRHTGSYAVKKAQPITNEVPVKHSVTLDDSVVMLARAVAEATASATMKAMVEVLTPQQPRSATLYSSSPETNWVEELKQWYRQAKPQHNEGEFVPVSKAAWVSGLSDSTCRKLIGFAKVPVRSNGGARGLLVDLPAMETAAQKLLDEATPPKGSRKRWTHPRFGNFTYYADLI